MVKVCSVLTDWKNTQARTKVTNAFPALLFSGFFHGVASIYSHSQLVSSAPTLLCMSLAHWEPCLARCAQGWRISVGFQRREGEEICYASEITAACSSQWTGAMLICKHVG